MNRFYVFFVISLLIHVPLFFYQVKPEPAPINYTPIDIVQRDPVIPPLPPVDTPVSPPEQVLPVTPETDLPPEFIPEPSAPETLTPPAPSTTEPSTAPQPPSSSEPSTSTPVIVPDTYDPDSPPAPFSYRELLEERDRIIEQTGPDRRLDDIVRDYLSTEHEGSDDTISFHNMSVQYDSYFYKFARSLYGTWAYPEESARRGEKGIVRVTFSITKDGKVINVNMLESSGYTALDREVMRTLRSMAPVPLPESFEQELMNINGFFIYTLDGQYRLY